MAWPEKRGSGYRGSFRDLDGKVRHTPIVKSKRAAKQAAEEEEAKVRAGTWTDPAAGNLTLDEYFWQQWLPNRLHELNTETYYEAMYRGGIRDDLGHYPLKAISTTVVQQWVVKQVKAGDVQPGTIVKRVRALSTILAAKKGVSAMRQKLIRENPCEGVDLPVVDKRQVHIYEVEEVDALMRALGWWAPLVLALVEIGGRWGEILGLRVSELNLTAEPPYVHVRDTIVETTKAKSGNGSSWVWKFRPKNKKPRKVAISPELALMFRKLIMAQGLRGEDRLFSSPSTRHDGLPARTETWPEGLPPFRRTVRDAWLRAHQEAGVERESRRIHDLRGSHITWLAAGGADLPTIMARVGHSNVATTQVYLDAMADADSRGLSALRATQQRGRRGA